MAPSNCSDIVRDIIRSSWDYDNVCDADEPLREFGHFHWYPIIRLVTMRSRDVVLGVRVHWLHFDVAFHAAFMVHLQAT